MMRIAVVGDSGVGDAVELAVLSPRPFVVVVAFVAIMMTRV